MSTVRVEKEGVEIGKETEVRVLRRLVERMGKGGE